MIQTVTNQPLHDSNLVHVMWTIIFPRRPLKRTLNDSVLRKGKSQSVNLCKYVFDFTSDRTDMDKES